MCSPGCRVQVLMEGRVEQWSRSLGMSTWVKLHMVLYAGSKEIRCSGPSDDTMWKTIGIRLLELFARV